MNSVSPPSPAQVYTERTPNPDAMKFVVNRVLLKSGTKEFKFGSEAAHFPIVQQLFNFPFVRSVFVGSNFITITKTDASDWMEVAPALRAFLLEQFDAHPRFIVEAKGEAGTQIANPSIQEPSNEIEEKIVAILDEYIRPAVEGDGGNIAFRGFESGVVRVELQGSCSGCPSSIVTLKAGIEALLKRMVPEVEQVIAENQTH
jgi:Fe-S cluster biogenesis protein NfuA